MSRDAKSFPAYKNPFTSDEFLTLAEKIIGEHAAEVAKTIGQKSAEESAKIAKDFQDDAMKKVLAKWREGCTSAIGALSNQDVAGVVGEFLVGGPEEAGSGGVGMFLPAKVMKCFAKGLDTISVAHTEPIVAKWLAAREKEVISGGVGVIGGRRLPNQTYIKFEPVAFV